MCTAPPPPPLPQIIISNNNELKYCRQKLLKVCDWASFDPELQQACAKYQICINKTPYKYMYKNFVSLLQSGPTCGLTALSMLINEKVTATEILKIAQGEGYTCNGEMFSCMNMLKLSKTVICQANLLNVNCYIKHGEMFHHDVIEKLFEGHVLLVPYDADFNNYPCLKKGHKSHWALICGIIMIQDPGSCYSSLHNNVYVLCKHGKSRFLSIWSLEDLDESNKNLIEFSPKRGEDGLSYVLPEDGIGGYNGLRNQFLLFEGI